MSQFNAKQLTVNDVINTGFIFEIPNYQRGYRWGKTEVTDLLDDIMDVVPSGKSKEEVRALCNAHPYCLQPIAFDTKNEDQGRMIVVDGQQRLTTLFLVLKFIEEKMNAIPQGVLPYVGIKDTSEYCRFFSLQYDDPGRNDVFEKVKNNLNAINTDNIDSYYITQAYQIIKEWSDENIETDVAELIIFAIKVFYGTSIIWYEIEEQSDGNSNDYFAKTNTGKIPLTNSELIKANLMLDEYCVKRIDENKVQASSDEEKRKIIANQKDLARVRLQNERIKMSRQWDEIESNLRNDEFWYFLAEKSDEYEDTRIDFIFDIVAKKLFSETDLAVKTYDEFMDFNKERGSFTIIARYLKAHENFGDDEIPIGLRVWDMAWNTYMVFKEWFESREWYHFIGYLISVKDGYDAKELFELFSDKKYLSKDGIRTEIVNKIMLNAHLMIDKNGKPEKMEYSDYSKYLEGLNYTKNGEAINNTLLLFNIISVLSDGINREASSRDTFFPFSRYKKESWNLEHIHSKADGASFTEESASEYKKYLEEMLERLKKSKGKNSDRITIEHAVANFVQKQKDLIQAGSDEKDALKFAAQDSAQLIAGFFDSDLDEKKLNGIGNMALLDEKTNKSYQNAPFFMKRMIIGDIVRGKKSDVSRFVPFCTRNVFDKAYTTHPDNMLHWTNEDCDEYINAIAETIWNYFFKKGE